jgi:hypothetical protein
VIAFAVVVAFVSGGFFGSRLTERNDVEVIHAITLSRAALKTTECVMLLKGTRQGNQARVNDRLESLLDFAVIDLAREYTPSRDYYGTAAKAVAQAREYRTAYPRKTTLARVDQEVATALTINTPQSQ